MHPSVAHLVYLTAFALDVGESAQQNALIGGDDVGDLGAAIEFASRRRAKRCSRSSPTARSRPSTTTARRTSRAARPNGCGRSPWASLADTVNAAAWREKPATYVVCTDDRALPVALQRSAAARIATSIDWPTSHSPFLEPARPRGRPADRPQLALTIAATSASEVTRAKSAPSLKP